MATDKPSLLSITASAQENIVKMLASMGDDILGVRISLKTKGCSGLSWDMEVLRHPNEEDDKIPLNNKYTVFIDKKATLYILGTVLDYHETELENGFSFTNPKEKGRCGCGQSFFV